MPKYYKMQISIYMQKRLEEIIDRLAIPINTGGYSKLLDGCEEHE